MKCLLPILLLGIICFGQKLPDDAKVTVYRLYDEVDDGPCSVREYVKFPEFSGGFVTAESSDKTFVKGLLELNKGVRKKADLNYDCAERSFGGQSVPNMFVVSGSNIADTVYTDYTNQKIFFPDKQKAYVDKDKHLINSFPKNIREFYDYDFNRHLYRMYSDVRDTVPISDVNHHNISLPEFLREFKLNPEPFKLIRNHPSKSDYKWEYDRDSINTWEGFSIQINNPKSGWNIAGIVIGSSEQALKNIFPISTEISFISQIRFEDIKQKYFYSVNLEGGKGRVAFYIKDHYVESINIYYDE